MQLFFAGKLKVTGNQMLAMKLHEALPACNAPRPRSLIRPPHREAPGSGADAPTLRRTSAPPHRHSHPRPFEAPARPLRHPRARGSRRHGGQDRRRRAAATPAPLPPHDGRRIRGVPALEPRQAKRPARPRRGPRGATRFRRLVASYDVLFDQFRPGVLDRLGLGHAALRADNPRLIDLRADRLRSDGRPGGSARGTI